MKNKYPLLFWSPRVITIGFALFISFFALDAIQPGRDWQHNLLDLFMHLHPVLILAVALMVSWKYEWLGAILFLFFAITYIYWAWGRFPLSVYFVIAGPLFVISLLFGIGWYFKKKSL